MESALRHITLSFQKFYIYLFLSWLLVACGGGGSGPGVVTGPAVPDCTAQSSGNSITLSGIISYERVPHTASSGLDYSATYSTAARGVTVELIDSRTRTVLASTTTRTSASGSEPAGFYSFQAPDNTAVSILARAELARTGSPSWLFQIRDNTHAGALYAIEGNAICTGADDETRNLLAPSGWTGNAYNTATRSAGPFAILDTIYDGVEKITAIEPAINLPPLTLYWSIHNTTTNGNPALGQIGTSFFDGTSIYLLGAENNDTDEYDAHVIAHEWGHYIEHHFSRSDSPGGAHFDGDRLDMRVAFSEGFSTAFAAMVLDDAIYRDSLSTFQAFGFDFNIEYEVPINPGWYSEQSVQEIIYDLIDDVADGSDNISLGFAPVWASLLAQGNNPALTSIFSFIAELKAANSGQTIEIDALVNSQNIASTNIDAYGSGETNNANDTSGIVLPAYVPVNADGTPQQFCVTDRFYSGSNRANIIGARRLLRFSITTQGNYQFSVSSSNNDTATDPDIILYQVGEIASAESYNPGVETLNMTMMQPGEYILEFYDWNLFFAAGNPSARTRCFDVTITAL